MYGKEQKNRMKLKLMIQSLAPLAFLTIISNFSFETQDSAGVVYPIHEFVCHNLPLLCVVLLCVLWTLYAIKIYVWDFGIFRWKDKSGGYGIINAKEDKEASLNFFLTLIIPLLIDNVSTIQGAITFVCILFIICVLLYRTNLFFANPILALLGYHLYSFEFEKNDKMGKKKYMGLCKGKVSDGTIVEYGKITEDVLYIKGMSI